MTSFMMKDARKNLTDLVNRVGYGGERIAISRRGKDLAVLVSVEDAAILEEMEDRLDVEAALKVLREEKESIPWEQAKKELAAMRAGKRRRR